MSDMRKVGALWKGTTRNGGTFYSGKLNAEAMKSALTGDETRLLLFPVKNKRNAKAPDVELFCVPDERRESKPKDTLPGEDF